MHERSRRAEAEAEERFIAILGHETDPDALDRIEAFASTDAVAETPDAVACFLLEPIRTGRCERFPARFWFIAADIFHRADRHADCHAALARAFATASDDDIDDCSYGYHLLGLLEASHHEWRRAVAAWENCLKLLPRESEIEQIVLSLLGEGWEALGCPDRASARFMEALKLSARRGDVARECEVLFQLGRHARDRGWTDQAMVYLDQALLRAREARYRAGEAAAEIGIGDIHLEMGEIGAAREMIDAGLSKAREVEDRLLQANALERRADLENRAGNADVARSSLEEAIFLARGANAHAVLAALYHMLAMLHEASGKKTLALGAYENALRERRRAGDSAGLGASLNNLASLHLELGDPAAARRLYREALVAFSECGHERKETEIVIENIRSLDAAAPSAPETLRATDLDDPADARHRGTEPPSPGGDGGEDPIPLDRPLPPPIPFPGHRDRKK